MSPGHEATPPGGSSGSTARVNVLQDNHCVATWHRFLIVIFRHDTTVEAINDVRHALEKLESTEKSVALLTIIEPNAPPPSSDVRDAMAAMLAEFGRVIKYSAVAFEGSGFRAAVVRGVVTGLTLLARMPYPHKVFAGVDDAAQWMINNVASLLGWRETVTQLTDAVAELRRRIAAV